MSTPLELAQEIVWDRFNEFNTSVAFGVVKSLAQAVIEAEKQREPVEINKQDWKWYGKYPCCGRYGGEGNPAFCQYCGRPLKWTKEKAR